MLAAVTSFELFAMYHLMAALSSNCTFSKCPFYHLFISPFVFVFVFYLYLYFMAVNHFILKLHFLYIIKVPFPRFSILDYYTVCIFHHLYILLFGHLIISCHSMSSNLILDLYFSPSAVRKTSNPFLNTQYRKKVPEKKV